MTTNADAVTNAANDAAQEAAQRAALKELSPQDFARLGVAQIAYISPMMVDGATAIAIHAADGTRIGAAPNAALAFAAIIEHEMAPALVH